MQIEEFKTDVMGVINNNFDVYNKYLHIQKENVFPELYSQINEIAYTLIFGFSMSAITLTNNLLEKLLKNALIKNELGLGGLELEKWNDTFTEINKRILSINLHESINNCNDEDLISNKDKQILHSQIKDQIRNGFSHADSSKILSKHPASKSSIILDLNDGSTSKEHIDLVNSSPSMREDLVRKFAKSNAAPYFEFVVKLMQDIELRLVEKNKK